MSREQRQTEIETESLLLLHMRYWLGKLLLFMFLLLLLLLVNFISVCTLNMGV